LAHPFSGQTVPIGHFLKGFRGFGEDAFLEKGLLPLGETLSKPGQALLQDSQKLFPFHPGFRPFPLIGEELGDGNFWGRYERPDDEMFALWRTGVAETREKIETGWD
jgi:hypothetical protein